MQDPRLSGIPLILETPAAGYALEAGELAIWTKEIQLLYEIQAIPDTEWETKKVEIENRWGAERDTLNSPKEKKGKGGKGDGEDKKQAKQRKKAKKAKDEDQEACESHAEESDG